MVNLRATQSTRSSERSRRTARARSRTRGATFSSGGRVRIWAGVGISTGCGRNFAKVEQKPQLAERNARFHFRKESQAGLFLLARHTSIIACFRRSGVEHSLHARAPVRHHRRERESYLRTHEALADRAGACLSRAAASSALIFFSRWRGVVWGGLPAKSC